MASFLDKAQQILTHHGLDQDYYCPRNTKGGGDCFFHALVDQLSDPQIRASIRNEVKGKPINAKAIRERIVDFARRNQELLLGDETVLNMLESDEAGAGGDRDIPTIWDEYLRAMRKPGEWATELIVKIAAHYFGKDIRAIKETYEATWHGGNQAVDPPFVIVNMEEMHFQSVHRRTGLNISMEAQDGQRQPNSNARSGASSQVFVKNPSRGARSCTAPKPDKKAGDANAARPTLLVCMGCGKSFKQIMKHLAQSRCKDKYDQEQLQQLNIQSADKSRERKA